MAIKAIERATGHYKRLVDEPKQTRVPEWDVDGDEFTIYSTPLTLKERMTLNRVTPNPIEMAAEVLIMKAKDKEGVALFSKEDKPDLMRATDATVIRRIAEAIVDSETSDQEKVEEAEKN